MKTWIFSTTSLVMLLVLVAPVLASHTPTTVCHKPGTPAEHTLVVDEHAVSAHIGHGDYLGACRSTPTATPTDSVATLSVPTPTPTVTPSPNGDPVPTRTTTDTTPGLPTPHITMPPTDTGAATATRDDPTPWFYWVILGVSLVGNIYQALLFRWLKRNPDSLPARE